MASVEHTSIVFLSPFQRPPSLLIGRNLPASIGLIYLRGMDNSGALSLILLQIIGSHSDNIIIEDCFLTPRAASRAILFYNSKGG
jgi:hypothetical protein